MIIKCKYCDKDFKVELKDSLNPKVDKDAFLKTYMGEVFIHKCINCGKENLIVYPVTYVDTDKEFMVQLAQDIKEAKIYKDKYDNMCNDKIYGTYFKNLKFRIVINSPFNFMKKVCILNYKLDEKKIDNYEKKIKKENGAMDVSFYANVDKDFFYFLVRYNDNSEEIIGFEKEIYEKL